MKLDADVMFRDTNMHATSKYIKMSTFVYSKALERINKKFTINDSQKQLFVVSAEFILGLFNPKKLGKIFNSSNS